MDTSYVHIKYKIHKTNAVLNIKMLRYAVVLNLHIRLRISCYTLFYYNQFVYLHAFIFLSCTLSFFNKIVKYFRSHFLCWYNCEREKKWIINGIYLEEVWLDIGWINYWNGRFISGAFRNEVLHDCLLATMFEVFCVVLLCPAQMCPGPPRPTKND